jgi:cytochrome P450
MADASSAPPPPGRLGLPWVGETLALLRNPFRFLDVRQQRYGDVFVSRVLGRTTVFLAGKEGAEAFYDPDNISRAHAHPYPIVDLFGGVNMEMYDGPRHRALKEIALSAFDVAAIDGYLPAMQSLISTRLAGWAGTDEFPAAAGLRNLAIELICRNLLGLTPGPATDAMCRDYGLVLKGIVSIPVAVPGTPYRQARASRDRLLETIRGIVRERRQVPGDDGLSRLLAARSSDGRAITDDEAVLEVHHIVIAGFIVYALMGEAMRRLAEDQSLRAACRSEVDSVGVGDLSIESLGKLARCREVVLETKRLVPLVPLAFGRAARTFTCGGCRVREGWRVYLALHLCNLDGRVYRDPGRFDPGRFAPPRAEHEQHPLAFIPQGAGPPSGHQCLGVQYSTYATLAFLAVLLAGYEWDLPAQSLAYRWNTIPPEPQDGMRVRLRPRSA